MTKNRCFWCVTVGRFPVQTHFAQNVTFGQKRVKNDPKMTHFWWKMTCFWTLDILDMAALQPICQKVAKNDEKYVKKWGLKIGSKMTCFWPVRGFRAPVSVKGHIPDFDRKSLKNGQKWPKIPYMCTLMYTIVHKGSYADYRVSCPKRSQNTPKNTPKNDPIFTYAKRGQKWRKMTIFGVFWGLCKSL